MHPLPEKGRAQFAQRSAWRHAHGLQRLRTVIAQVIAGRDGRQRRRRGVAEAAETGRCEAASDSALPVQESNAVDLVDAMEQVLMILVYQYILCAKTRAATTLSEVFSSATDGVVPIRASWMKYRFYTCC
jgi:hypothetical protein